MQPSDLGIPAPLDRFRPEQARAFDWLVGDTHRASLLALPPGLGKSHIAFCYTRLLGARGVLLTSTNPLLEQYRDIYRPFGLVDVRGMRNYPCKALPYGRCDIGPCLDGEQCMWKSQGCHYFDQVRAAAAAPIAATNYDFWFTHAESPTGPVLGDRDLLICDEAHDLPAKLGAAAGARFTGDEVDLHPDMADWPERAWEAWAHEKGAQARRAYELGGSSLTAAERRDLRDLARRFTRVAEGLATGAWAWEYVPGRLVRFEPIDVAPYADWLLFRGIPRIVLMSATIRPGLAQELGLDAAGFHEAPSPFAVERRPIYWLKCGARLSGGPTEATLVRWAAACDAWLGPRLAEKGLVHTVSYPRARELKERSRYGRHMVIHESSDLKETVARFKAAKPPYLLVSPSIHTGHDFPNDLARHQLIAKVPFPDCRVGIAKARADFHRHYQERHAARTLEQTAGRVVRGSGDYGETAIVDDAFGYLFSRFRTYFSGWFRQAVQTIDLSQGPPPPPIRL
jgi:Rad3-related DNA helicase